MNELPRPTEPEKQIDNIKRFNRRSVLITGASIAGGSVIGQLLCYKLGIGFFQERDSHFSLPQGDPFAAGEEVDQIGFYDKQYGGKILSSALTFPTFDLKNRIFDNEYHYFIPERKELETLEVKPTTIIQHTNSSFHLFLELGKNVKTADNYDNDINPAAFGVVFPDDVLTKKGKKYIDVEFIISATIDVAFEEEEEDYGGLMILGFPYNLQNYANKNIVFFLNKGLTSDSENKPKFLPVKLRVPHIPLDQKKS